MISILAVIQVVQQSYGIADAELAGAVCRLLGFARANEESTQLIGRHCDDLVREGRLVRNLDRLTVAPTGYAQVHTP